MSSEVGSSGGLWPFFNPTSPEFKQAEKIFHEELSWERQALVVATSVIGALIFIVGAFPVFCWTVKKLIPGESKGADKTNDLASSQFNPSAKKTSTSGLGKAASIANANRSEMPPVDFFGEEVWKKHFGELRNVPELPKNIHEILNAESTHFPGKKVWQTHALILIPGEIRLKGKSDYHQTSLEVCIDILKEQSRDKKNPPPFITPVLEEYNLQDCEPSYWCLITKDAAINGSISGNSYKNVVEKLNPYKPVSLREMTIYFFMQYAQFSEYRYGPSVSDPSEYEFGNASWTTLTSNYPDGMCFADQPYRIGINKHGTSITLTGPENSMECATAFSRRC